MPITQDFLDRMAGVSFDDAAAVNAYFTSAYGSDFVSWFVAHVGGKGSWGQTGNHAPLSFATDADVHDRFSGLWSPESIGALSDAGGIGLLQFLSLQSIILNETGGSLKPMAERVGLPGHPGIAYAFDAIPNLKASYNTLAGNRTCLDLFNDDGYNGTFGARPLADQLRGTTDPAWRGTAWPPGVPTATDPAVTGYALEADFYKFRGRGLIQTTGRSNYKAVIDFVLGYGGDNGAVVNARATWSANAADADAVATVSANTEWDDLFLNSGYLIPAKAIALHNAAAGDYLGHVDGTSPATAAATVRNVGYRVSGGSAYADLFLDRVTQIIEAM